MGFLCCTSGRRGTTNSRPNAGSRLVLWLRLCLYTAAAAAIAFRPLAAMVEAVGASYGADVRQPLSDRALAQYRSVKRHLESPFEGYGRLQVLVPPFSVVLLSHMACGLHNVAVADPGREAEVGPLLEAVLARALSPQVSPYGASPEGIADFGDHGLYLSHLNLILGCRRQVIGDATRDALHRRVSEHLASRSMADGDAHARSFPGSPKFPADQAATLASLRLYDACANTNLSAGPVRAWLDYMAAAGAHRETGLHRSSLAADDPKAAAPRGCALSWTCLYMAQFAPEQGRDLYIRYRDIFFGTVLGCGGFREFLPGAPGLADVDSGPIVADYGAAATGIGLAAARLYQDEATYAALMRTATTIGIPSVLRRQRAYLLAPWLGEAILFHAQTALPWTRAPAPAPAGGNVPAPILPASLGIVLFACLDFCVWRARTVWLKIQGRIPRR